MGCCGGRDEEVRLREEQKWDYIVRYTLSYCHVYCLSNTG